MRVTGKRKQGEPSCARFPMDARAKVMLEFRSPGDPTSAIGRDLYKSSRWGPCGSLKTWGARWGRRPVISSRSFLQQSPFNPEAQVAGDRGPRRYRELISIR